MLNLASTFRGMLYYANGSIQPVQTDAQNGQVYIYSNANVINGDFNYKILKDIQNQVSTLPAAYQKLASAP